MPGKRQPTQVLEANGRKHLTEAEKDARRDREVHVPPPDEVAPPKWLPKRLHGEYREIGEILRAMDKTGCPIHINASSFPDHGTRPPRCGRLTGGAGCATLIPVVTPAGTIV